MTNLVRRKWDRAIIASLRDGGSRPARLTPGKTWYWLRPRACRMLAVLGALAAWYDEAEGQAYGASRRHLVCW